MIDLGRKPLTLENVRELVSDESVWHWLLPDFQRVNKKFKVRKEGQPSAIIKYRNGILFYKDFGNTIQFNPWWKYLMEQGYSFQNSLELVRDTFNLPLGFTTANKINTVKTPKIYQKKEYKESKTIIRYRSREWGWMIDNNYWYDKYEINTNELDFFKVIPCKYYWIDNGINYRFKAEQDDPVYCYPIGNRRKVYRPLNNEGFKWTSNTTKDDIFGLHLLKEFDNIEYLFIESSYKDTMVMFKGGFPSLPTPSENSFLPEEFFYKMIKKGIKPILHFDNDEAGITNAKVFSEKYNIPYLTIPEIYNNSKLIKDPSDFVEFKGYEELKRLINNQLTNIK